MLAFEFADHGRQSTSMESVAKTWSLSFDWLRNNNLRAIDLLCLISFFQHNGIPQRLLRGAGGNEDAEEDEFDFEDAMAALHAFSFVDVSDADDGTEITFSTHRLVQLATRWWLQSEGVAETERWPSLPFNPCRITSRSHLRTPPEITGRRARHFCHTPRCC